jgi:hypothetical protein
MAAKLIKFGSRLQFHCPCGEDHCVSAQVHTWNGSLDAPTFQPSLLSEGPGVRCHSSITAGKIAFCNDSKHKFAGQTLDLPDWETKEEGAAAMAEKKQFSRGDLVSITAPHISGVTAEILWEMVDGKFVCRIASSDHPSGHSQEGTIVVFPPDQLEKLDGAEKSGGEKKEVQL